MNAPQSPLETDKKTREIKDISRAKVSLRYLLSVFALLVVFLVAGSLFFFQEISRDKGFRLVQIRDIVIQVQVADTPELQEKGLAGRPNLPRDEGLLFVFGKAAPHSFWMKGMRFSIDILWFDEEGFLIHAEERVSPDTYPKVFSSHKDSLFALEVSAGFVEENGIKLGDTLRF
jgi:uncharacterized membrane protein (UPF0127 family)